MHTCSSEIHICVIQPAGYTHSLGFLDQARFFRYQFRRLGAQVTIGKNRLRRNAINFIFGTHLGFDITLAQHYRCVFVNLEQIGALGQKLPKEYLRILAEHDVVDYDPKNVSAYRSNGKSVPIISFGYAPYLADDGCDSLESRPIDVLFFGSMNERRERLLREIQASGSKVSVVPFGVYGPERDMEIRRAKAVFNCHFYEAARFEQARAFHCLSLGTPVISERTENTSPPPQFENSIFWVPTKDVRNFFETDFKSASFFDSARTKISNFASVDVLNQYVAVLDQLGCSNAAQRPPQPKVWRPENMQIGSGKSYMMGWFNVDISELAQPDALLDLAKPVQFPVHLECETVGPVELAQDSLQLIYANNVLEHVADLPQLMTNCLQLLRVGGQMLIEVPYEHAPSAWQDPTHVRALNENSWIYYTEWFWYLGWFNFRFEIQESVYLDEKLVGCKQEFASFMRVRLVKVETTAVERSIARSSRADFGGLPLDDLP